MVETLIMWTFCPSQTVKDLRKLVVGFHSSPAKLGWALVQPEVKVVAEKHRAGICLVTEVSFANHFDWFSCRYRFRTSLRMDADRPWRKPQGILHYGVCLLLLRGFWLNSLSQATALKVTPFFCETVLILTRDGHSTPGGVSREQSRGAESPPSTC